MDQIFGIDRYGKFTKPNKIWGTKMGVFPKPSLPNFKLFNLLSWRHEIFKVTKYKKTIKFDQIWGFQNRIEVFSNEAAKIQNFLTILVRQMKFLEMAIRKIR